jgi:hypothetical protein
MTQKQTWIDTYLGKCKWFRKLRGGYWYKHVYTNDAYELRLDSYRYFWARYGEVNLYSVVVEQEIY